MGVVGEAVGVKGGLVKSGEGGDVGYGNGDGDGWAGVGYGGAGDAKMSVAVTDQEADLP